MTFLCDLTGPGHRWEQPEVAAWRRAVAATLTQVDPSLGAPREGDPMLRQGLADVLQVPYQRVVVTAGIRAAVGPLLRGANDVLMERPTFLGVLNAMRRERLRVHSGSWERLIDADVPGAARWFTAPCRNPDGLRVDDRFLAGVGALADLGHRVVCNTAYRWFAAVPRLPDSVLVAGTLHKLAGRGARLGWVVAVRPGDELLSALATTAPPLHWQRSWAHFLAAGGVDLLCQRHQHLDAARTAFFSALGRPDAVTDQEGPNILIPVAMPEERALELLAAAGVWASPGSAFHACQPSIRVCLTRISPELAGQAGARVAEALARHRPASAGSGAGRD